jgi:hypothetical protein
MFTRSALALVAAASVVAGSAGVADAARDGHWGHGPHTTVVVSGGVVFGYPPAYPVYPGPVVVARPPVYYAPPPVVYTRPVVVAPAPVVVAAPVVVSHADTVPADLHLTAYKTQDLVTVVISGSNPCGNYSTSLTCTDHEWTPTLLLRNTPGAESAGAASAFTLNAAVRVTHPISSITVRVADQTYQVAVTEVPLIS